LSLPRPNWTEESGKGKSSNQVTTGPEHKRSFIQSLPSVVHGVLLKSLRLAQKAKKWLINVLLVNSFHF